MQVVILTAGSTGDVAPYTGLAVRLQAAGHDVAIATHRRFAPMVRGCGVGFRLLKGDPAVLQGMADGDDGEDTPAFEPGIGALVRNVKLAAAVTRDYAHDVAAAAQADGGADVLLLSATVAPLAWHAAESLGVPSVGVYLQPTHPSRAFAPPYITSRSFGPHGNLAVGRVTELVIDRWIAAATKQLRAELGLPPLAPGDLRRRLETEEWPVCYGFSPAVVPRPDDWRPGLEVVGYWWPEHLAGWRPPPELVDFLDAGPPPVLVDFGSKGRDQAERLNAVIRSALRRAGIRAVIRSGWAGLSGAPVGEDGSGDRTAVDDDGDTITIDEVDHAWLLPRTAAVVHHAGAGTTAATLRAGVPSVPVPFDIDSAFWAGRLDALGVSPGQLPLRRLSVDTLDAALRAAVSDPTYRDRAAALAGRIAAEDGAGRVLETVTRSVAERR